MRFLDKAGPWSKATLILALLFGEAAAVTGSDNERFNPSTTSILSDVGNQNQGYWEGIAQGVESSPRLIVVDWNPEAPMIDDNQVSFLDDAFNKRGAIMSSNALGMIILGTTVLASTAAIRHMTHMHILPPALRKTFNIEDGPVKPGVYKITQEELKALEAQQAKAKEENDKQLSKREVTDGKESNDSSVEKRAFEPTSGLSGASVAKYAALAGLGGYLLRAWQHPPAPPQYYRKRDVEEESSVEVVKRSPAVYSYPKAAGLIGLAGFAGWLSQVYGHEAKDQYPYGRRDVADEGVLVRRGTDSFPFVQVRASANDGTPPESLSITDENFNVNLSNSASSRLKEPRALFWQILVIALVTICILTSSSQATEIDHEQAEGTLDENKVEDEVASCENPVKRGTPPQHHYLTAFEPGTLSYTTTTSPQYYNSNNVMATFQNQPEISWEQLQQSHPSFGQIASKNNREIHQEWSSPQFLEEVDKMNDKFEQVKVTNSDHSKHKLSKKQTARIGRKLLYASDDNHKLYQESASNLLASAPSPWGPDEDGNAHDFTTYPDQFNRPHTLIPKGSQTSEQSAPPTYASGPRDGSCHQRKGLHMPSFGAGVASTFAGEVALAGAIGLGYKARQARLRSLVPVEKSQSPIQSVHDEQRGDEIPLSEGIPSSSQASPITSATVGRMYREYRDSDMPREPREIRRRGGLRKREFKEEKIPNLIDEMPLPFDDQQIKLSTPITRIDGVSSDPLEDRSPGNTPTYWWEHDASSSNGQKKFKEIKECKRRMKVTPISESVGKVRQVAAAQSDVEGVDHSICRRLIGGDAEEVILQKRSPDPSAPWSQVNPLAQPNHHWSSQSSAAEYMSHQSYVPQNRDVPSWADRPSNLQNLSNEAYEDLLRDQRLYNQEASQEDQDYLEDGTAYEQDGQADYQDGQSTRLSARKMIETVDHHVQVTPYYTVPVAEDSTAQKSPSMADLAITAAGNGAAIGLAGGALAACAQRGVRNHRKAQRRLRREVSQRVNIAQQQHLRKRSLTPFIPPSSMPSTSALPSYFSNPNNELDLDDAVMKYRSINRYLQEVPPSVMATPLKPFEGDNIEEENKEETESSPSTNSRKLQMQIVESPQSVVMDAPSVDDSDSIDAGFSNEYSHFSPGERAAFLAGSGAAITLGLGSAGILCNGLRKQIQERNRQTSQVQQDPNEAAAEVEIAPVIPIEQLEHQPGEDHPVKREEIKHHLRKRSYPPSMLPENFVQASGVQVASSLSNSGGLNHDAYNRQYEELPEYMKRPVNLQEIPRKDYDKMVQEEGAASTQYHQIINKPKKKGHRKLRGGGGGSGGGHGGGGGGHGGGVSGGAHGFAGEGSRGSTYIPGAHGSSSNTGASSRSKGMTWKQTGILFGILGGVVASAMVCKCCWQHRDACCCGSEIPQKRGLTESRGEINTKEAEKKKKSSSADKDSKDGERHLFKRASPFSSPIGSPEYHPSPYGGNVPAFDLSSNNWGSYSGHPDNVPEFSTLPSNFQRLGTDFYRKLHLGGEEEVDRRLENKYEPDYYGYAPIDEEAEAEASSASSKSKSKSKSRSKSASNRKRLRGFAGTTGIHGFMTGTVAGSAGSGEGQAQAPAPQEADSGPNHAGRTAGICAGAIVGGVLSIAGCAWCCGKCKDHGCLRKRSLMNQGKAFMSEKQGIEERKQSGKSLMRLRKRSTTPNSFNGSSPLSLQGADVPFYNMADGESSNTISYSGHPDDAPEWTSRPYNMQSMPQADYQRLQMESQGESQAPSSSSRRRTEKKSSSSRKMLREGNNKLEVVEKGSGGGGGGRGGGSSGSIAGEEEPVNMPYIYPGGNHRGAQGPVSRNDHLTHKQKVQEAILTGASVGAVTVIGGIAMGKKIRDIRQRQRQERINEERYIEFQRRILEQRQQRTEQPLHENEEGVRVENEIARVEQEVQDLHLDAPPPERSYSNNSGRFSKRDESLMQSDRLSRISRRQNLFKDDEELSSEALEKRAMTAGSRKLIENGIVATTSIAAAVGSFIGVNAIFNSPPPIVEKK